MEWPTAGEWLAIVAVWLGGSFLAGFIETWLEQRKWEKELKARERKWARERKERKDE